MGDKCSVEEVLDSAEENTSFRMGDIRDEIVTNKCMDEGCKSVGKCPSNKKVATFSHTRFRCVNSMNHARRKYPDL